VYHCRQSFELGFEIGCGTKKYALSELIRATDPDVAKQYRKFAAVTQSALTKGIAQLTGLVKRYGRQALQGDPEFFAGLEQKRKPRADEYAHEVLEFQLRPKAHDAFRRGAYREAAELY
jgi:hypothetical protein